MTKKAIIWFRRDLRLSDNTAIAYAEANNFEIIFLYIDDAKHQIGSAAKWFLHHSLSALAHDIKQKYNTDLLIKVGDSKTILQDLIKSYQINNIIFNKIYEPEYQQDDKAIAEYFHKQNIAVKTFNSSLLFNPKNIKNQSGGYFKIFTPYWRKALTLAHEIKAPYKIPAKLNTINITNKTNHNLADLNLLPTKPNWAREWHNYYKISEESAHDLADEFIQSRLDKYKIGRDFPATNNTSKLSPYLHFGLISPKQIFYKTLPYENSPGYESFLSEIGWREFSHYLLYYFKELAYKNFKSNFDNFTWENNLDNLAKWQKGQTGIPIIDAGMRQLYQTGWMHNRVRMLVASFLTKNLLIDWRYGYSWFMDSLVDADIAANAASWQWVAGSGSDASPYFRIFNPVTQSQKFDPNGDYIRQYVPEIAHLSKTEIHLPTTTLSNYPKPIVDLSSSRQKALSIYKVI